MKRVFDLMERYPSTSATVIVLVAFALAVSMTLLGRAILPEWFISQ